MIYPYLCSNCGIFDVSKRMSESSRPEPCPSCSTVVAEQHFAAKRLGGFLPQESNWIDGKVIQQLPPYHPDYHVTSKRQMEQVYKRNGLNMDTGSYVDNEAQVKATLPRNKRTGRMPKVVSGVDD